MDQQTQQQISNIVSELATKLGTTAETFWPIWVKYTFATHLTQFLINILAALLCIIILVFCIILFRKNWNEAVAKEDAGEEGWGSVAPSRHSVTCIVTAIVGITAFAVGCNTFGYALGQLPALLVPEAQAVADILALAIKSTK